MVYGTGRAGREQPVQMGSVVEGKQCRLGSVEGRSVHLLLLSNVLTKQGELAGSWAVSRGKGAIEAEKGTVKMVLGQTRHHSLHDESLTRKSVSRMRPSIYVFARVLMGPGLRATSGCTRRIAVQPEKLVHQVVRSTRPDLTIAC